MAKKRNIVISIFIATVIAGSVFYTQSSFSCRQLRWRRNFCYFCDGTGSTAIINIIKQVIKILTAGVLVAAVGAVIYGAFLYTTLLEGSPDKIKKAREVWTNTVIGIIMFAFMGAITNFIIRGGVFD